MKFTLNWLKDHLDTEADVQTVTEAMTHAGLEVEHVDDPQARLAPFTIAHIVDAKPHPDADRLKVCTVATVDGALQIVCGAPNARAGIAVVYAAVGTYVPGIDVTLTKAKIRGVESLGMMCSARELLLGDDHDGIIELDPAQYTVGQPAYEALGGDAVIDFEVTPNRPDWLGVRGIARDLAAAGLGRFAPKTLDAPKASFACPITIETRTETCPMFAGRVIKGVQIKDSPQWLKDRLTAIGLRPINAVVDVTNFISYDRARPLHAYDAAKIAGPIHARMGDGQESFIALDEKTYTPTPEMCVIADNNGVLGLGGVMGGETSGVSATTTDVFLESALFDATTIAKTGRTLSLFSDAQYRFARGVDSGDVIEGLEAATTMIVEICGGEVSEIASAGELPAPPEAVRLSPATVRGLSGLEIGDEEIKTSLEALGFSVEAQGERWTVSVPTFRRDVTGEADLVEEITRIVGYDHIPATTLPPVDLPRQGLLNSSQKRARLARYALANAGYNEAISWSFVSETASKLFGGGTASLKLANPIASDLSDMRPSCLPGLLLAAGRNQAHAERDIALFEVGPVYHDDTPKGQRTAITALRLPHANRHWQTTTEEDLFTLKATLMQVLDVMGAPTANLTVDMTATHPGLAPGQSAGLRLGKTVVAVFGAIHPKVLKALDVDGPAFGFEIWMEALPPLKVKAHKTKPAFHKPDQTPVTRDFAFVVDGDVEAESLRRAARAAEKKLITDVRIFDLYTGPGVPEGQKSIALEVTLAPTGEALTEEAIDAIGSKVIANVENATNGKLRA